MKVLDGVTRFLRVTVMAGVALAATPVASTAVSYSDPNLASLAPRSVVSLAFEYWDGSNVDVDDVFCSGTLVAPDWVLTAAHCVAEISTDLDSYRVGVQSDGARSWVKISEIRFHPRFDESNYDSYLYAPDLALVKLSSPVGVDPMPVGLIKNGPEVLNPVVYGYGIDEFGNHGVLGAAPQVLTIDPAWLASHDFDLRPWHIAAHGVRTVSQPCDASRSAARSNTTAKSRIVGATRSPGRLVGISPHRCDPSTPPTVSKVRYSAACPGDSGGPLVVRQGDQLRLLGVVSYGVDCAAEAPAIFTRAGMFSGWISAVTSGRAASLPDTVPSTSALRRTLKKETLGLAESIARNANAIAAIVGTNASVNAWLINLAADEMVFVSEGLSWQKATGRGKNKAGLLTIGRNGLSCSARVAIISNQAVASDGGCRRQ